MVEVQFTQSTGSDNVKAVSKNSTTAAAIEKDTITVQVVPIAVGSPTDSTMRLRRRRHSRLMSNASSVVSAAAVCIQSVEKHKISLVEHFYDFIIRYIYINT